MIGKTVQDIAAALGNKISSSRKVSGFAVDSRKILPGSLFFALKGEKVDGHDFLEQVKEKGAIAAVVERGFQKKIPGLELIFVQDVLSSLKHLAKIKMEEQRTRCIGVTGSVGKTTTKEFIATLLQGSFRLGKTPGNENSQVGVPLSLLHAPSDLEVFIAEMGMSQKKEIASLVAVFPPEIAVVTQVALAHALYFPDGLEEVAEAKAEILSHPFTKKAFLHQQVSTFRAFNQQANPSLFFYGQEGRIREKGTSIEVIGENFRIVSEEERTREFSLPFKAKHLVENFLGAALVAKELGVSWEEIFERAKLLSPYQMRFEKIEKGGITFINDAYNANPASMKAALENLPFPGPGGKVIAALGHMGELGHFSKEAHEEIGKIASLHADLLFCLGQDTEHMANSFSQSGKKALKFSCFEDMKQALKEQVLEKDVVLVKASNSLKLWRLLEE